MSTCEVSDLNLLLLLLLPLLIAAASTRGKECRAVPLAIAVAVRE